MPVAYIGIGSNLGNRKENCLKAIASLSARGVVIRKQSTPVETEPWGVEEQPGFINMAVEIETVMAPRELLDALKKIEGELGRQITYRWGPRIIDLDILLYGDFVADEPDLKIPHPLMHLREFVLRPLSGIAPEVVHPILKKTVKSLLAGLRKQL